MWSNVISIDRKYDRELKYIKSRISQMSNLSYAMEESKDRVYIYLASLCENQDEVEYELEGVIISVFLSFIKKRFFKGINLNHPLDFYNVALMCSLIHFDLEYESNMVRRILRDSADYNVDGLLNFRLKTLTENWEDLLSVCISLVKDNDKGKELYDIATFITGNDDNKNQLVVDCDQIYNISKSEYVEVLSLFDEEEFNILSAIIKEHPSTINIMKGAFSNNLISCCKHITDVNIT